MRTQTPHDCYTLFNYKVERGGACRFFETKNESAGPEQEVDLVRRSTASIGSALSFEPFGNEFVLALNLPVMSTPRVAMNEFLAVYCLMFFSGRWCATTRL